MLKKIKNILLYRNLEGKDITYDTAKKIIKKERECYLIDVRSKQEYEEGHLQGAINIPDFELINRVPKEITKKNQLIVMYCQYGTRSRDAYIKMKKDS